MAENGAPVDQASSNSTKVNVAVRLRPLIQTEVASKLTSNWSTSSRVIQQVDPATGHHLPSAPPYPFDHVFGTDAKTEGVYKSVVAPIVQKSFEGFNGTILCYGQTSSGKTFTLYGDDDEPGIISLTSDDLFKRINQDSNFQYIIRVGLIEVYNEQVTDLLNSENPIVIVEKHGQVVPKELEEIQIYDSESMLKACRRVQRERKIGETRMNKESSRSHTILRIAIESFEKKDMLSLLSDTEDYPHVTKALLNFVDLAGSEKAHQTGATGTRLKEAGYINKSLSALSQVVMQLSEKLSEEAKKFQSSVNMSVTASVSKSKAPRYINFRDSKLTRLLQSSLEGNAYIAMVCNVTPAYIDETISTLRFAKAAKKIQFQTKPIQNNLRADKSEYENIISDLKSQLSGKGLELEALKKQLAVLTKFTEPQRTLVNAPNIRRQTVCPSQLDISRMNREQGLSKGPAKGFSDLDNAETKSLEYEDAPQQKDSLSPGFSDRYMTHDQALDLLREVTESREAEPKEFNRDIRTTEIPPLRREAAAPLSPESLPKKRRLIDGTHRDDTPKSTLIVQRSLLAQTNEDDQNEWREQKTFLEDEIKLKNAYLEDYESKLKEINAEKEKLVNELDKHKTLLSSKDYEVDTLFKQNQEKTKTIELLREQQSQAPLPSLDTSTDSSAVGDQTMMSLVAELEEYKTKLSELKFFLEEQELKNTKNEETLTEKVSKLKIISDQLSDVQFEKENLATQLTELSEKVREFYIPQLNDLHALLKTKENEMTTVKEDHKTAIDRLSQQREEDKEKNEQKFTEHLTELQTEKNKLVMENTELKDKVNENLTSLTELQSLLRKSQSDAESATAEIAQLNAKLQNLQKERDQYYQEYQDNERKAEEVKKIYVPQLDEFQTLLKAKEIEIISLKEEYKTVTDRFNQERNEDKQKNEQMFNEKLTEFQLEKDKMVTEIVELKDKVSENVASLTELKSVLKTKQNDAESASAVIVKLNAKLQGLQKERDQYYQEYQDNESKVEDVKRIYIPQLDEFQALLKTKENEIMKAKEECQNAVDRFNRLEDENVKNQRTASEQATELNTISAKLKEIQVERDQLVTENAELKDKVVENVELKDKVIENVSAQKELQALLKIRESEAEVASAEIVELNAKLQALQKERDHYYQKYQDNESQAEDVKNVYIPQLNDLQNLLKAKENDIISIKEECQSAVDRLNQQREESKEKEEHRFTENLTELQLEKGKLVTENAELKNKVIENVTELKEMQSLLKIKESEAKVAGSEIVQLNAKLQSLQMERDKYYQEYQDYERQAEEVKKIYIPQLDDLQTLLKAKEIEIISVKEEYKTATDRFNQKSKEDKEKNEQKFNEKLTDFQLEKDKLVTEIAELKDKVSENITSLAELQSLLKIKQRDAESASAVIVKLNAKLQGLQKERDQYYQEYKDNESKVEDVKRIYIPQLDEFQALLKTKENEIMKANEECQNAVDRFNRLEGENLKNQRTSTTQANELETISAKLKEIQLERNQLAEENLELKDKVVENITSLKELQSLLKIKKSEIENASAEIVKLNSKLQSLQKERDQYYQEYQDNESKAEDVRKIYIPQLDEFQTLLKRKENEVIKAKEECQSAVDRYNQLEEENLKNQRTASEQATELKAISAQLKGVLLEKDTLVTENKELQDKVAMGKPMPIAEPRVRKILVNRQTQTGDSIDICVHYKNARVQNAILTKDKQKLITEKTALEKAHVKELAQMEVKLKESHLESEQLRNSLCFMKEEQEAIKNAKGLVNTGIQCNYLSELVARSNNGEGGLMPEGFPDIVAVRKENSNYRARICFLEQGQMKCTCKMWNLKPARPTPTTSSQGLLPVDPSRPGGDWNYKDYLNKLKEKAKVDNFPQRKYNLRSTPTASASTLPVSRRRKASRSPETREASQPVPEAWNTVDSTPKSSQSVPKRGSSTSQALPNPGSNTSHALPNPGSSTSSVFLKPGSRTSPAVPKEVSQTSPVPNLRSKTSPTVPKDVSKTSPAVPKPGSRNSPTVSKRKSSGSPKVSKTGSKTSPGPSKRVSEASPTAPMPVVQGEPAVDISMRRTRSRANLELGPPPVTRRTAALTQPGNVSAAEAARTAERNKAWSEKLTQMLGGIWVDKD